MEVECPLPVLFLTTLVLTGTGSQRSERWKRHDGELLLKVVRADGKKERKKTQKRGFQGTPSAHTTMSGGHSDVQV